MNQKLFSLFVLVLLVVGQGYALPRFSATYEQNCFLCHVNPSGSGIRSSYGSTFYAMSELAIRPADSIDIAKYKPKIAPGIMVGADVRTLFTADDSTKGNTGLQMEGDVSFVFQPNDALAIVVQQGLSGVSQVYAKQSFQILHSYVKAGRFRPDYGWWLDDHTAFTRAPMRWRERYFDTGIELGIHPERWYATFSVLNGSGTAQRDNNSQKALLVSARYRPRLGAIKLGIGASAYRSLEPLTELSNQEGTLTIYGPHYSLAFGKLVFLGETDWKSAKARVGSAKRNSLFTTNTLYYEWKQGITPLVSYEFMDEDIDAKNGSVTRYAVGAQIFPTPFVEISPQIRIIENEIPGSDKKRATEAIVNLHFFY
ncbi:MAG: hypothetical protein OEM52_05840 [bacterium]|nr:hypothetical protein [bacterium]